MFWKKIITFQFHIWICSDFLQCFGPGPSGHKASFWGYEYYCSVGTNRTGVSLKGSRWHRHRCLLPWMHSWESLKVYQDYLSLALINPSGEGYWVCSEISYRTLSDWMKTWAYSSLRPEMKLSICAGMPMRREFRKPLVSNTFPEWLSMAVSCTPSSDW